MTYFFLGVSAALSLKEGNHLYLFPAALVMVGLAEPRVYRIFLRWKLWLFFVFLVAIPVFLLSPRDGRWFGVPFNSAMLRLNLLMVERSIILMLTIKMLTQRLSPQALSRGLSMLRLHQLDRVFALSQAMLPGLRETVVMFFKDVKWRQIVRRPDNLNTLLSRLVATVIFTARTSQMGEKMNTPCIALIVGRPNSGKTAWLAAIVQRARSRGIETGGLLSHGLWVNGEKSEYELEAVATGERRPLACMNKAVPGSSSSDKKNINPTAGPIPVVNAPGGKELTITCGRFQFSRFAFDWGNKILRTSSGIIVIDEFGPLEASGGGLWPGIDYLLRHHAGPLLIAVRPSLQADVLQRIRAIKQ